MSSDTHSHDHGHENKHGHHACGSGWVSQAHRPEGAIVRRQLEPT